MLRSILEEVELLSYWDLAKILEIDDAKGDLHDASLPWINKTKASCIGRLIKQKQFQTTSHVELVLREVYKEHNYGKKVMTRAGYEEGLNHVLTAWRGGGGVYDPSKYTRSWTSFTLNKHRITTFTEYDGTYASRAYVLDKRKGAHWVVKLQIKIKDVLLYLPHGQDDEIIVPTKLAKLAEPIKQTSSMLEQLLNQTHKM